MKIIDNEGKLFGKINIVDLFIIVILLMVIAFGITRVQQPQEDIQVSRAETIKIEFEYQDVRQETVDAIDIGDEVSDYSNNQYIGEVVDKRVSSHYEYLATSEGEVVKAEIPDKYNVRLTIKGQADMTNNKIMMANREIRIGKDLRVQGKKVVVRGYVMDIDV